MAKIILCEKFTGIVLNPDFSRFQRKGKEDHPYIYFNTRDEAMQYIDDVKRIDDSIEFTLWDGDFPPERFV